MNGTLAKAAMRATSAGSAAPPCGTITLMSGLLWSVRE